MVDLALNFFQNWYVVSKTLAEEAAWKFAKENKIDLVTLHPGLVIGPFLQSTLNLSVKVILDIVNGKSFSIKFIVSIKC